MTTSLQTNNISLWLQKWGLGFWQTDPGQWRIDLKHKHLSYTLTLSNQGQWFSFAAELMSNLSGNKLESFYEDVLKLNGRLNGVHVAMEGDSLILVRDDYSEDLSEDRLYRSLYNFHKSHEYVIKRLVDDAVHFDLSFRH
jgi:hypothetical protein